MAIQFSQLPLKLTQYFFPVSVFNFIPVKSKDEKWTLAPSFQISTTISKNKDHPEIFEVRVGVNCPEDAPDGKKYNLSFKVEALGFFVNTSKEEETEQIRQIIQLNASAILIGAIREHIASVTSKSPFGTYYLPSLHLRIEKDDVPEPAIKKEPDKKTTLKKKKTVKKK